MQRPERACTLRTAKIDDASSDGWVAEWLKAPVLKTGKG